MIPFLPQVPLNPEALPQYLENVLRTIQEAVNAPELRGYTATQKAIVSSGGLLTIDLSEGNVFTCTMSENITDIQIYRSPVAGEYAEFLLRLQQGASTAYTISWPTNFFFRSGTDHVMTATLGAHDWLAGRTIDGVNWDVDFGQDYQ